MPWGWLGFRELRPRGQDTARPRLGGHVLALSRRQLARFNEHGAVSFGVHGAVGGEPLTRLKKHKVSMLDAEKLQNPRIRLTDPEVHPWR